MTDAASSSTISAHSQVGGGDGGGKKATTTTPWVGSLVAGGEGLMASLKDEVYHHSPQAGNEKAQEHHKQQEHHESVASTPTSEERQFTEANNRMSDDIFESSAFVEGEANDDDDDDVNGGHIFYSACFLEDDEEDEADVVELIHQRQKEQQQQEEEKEEEMKEEEEVEGYQNENEASKSTNDNEDKEQGGMGSSSYYSEYLGPSYRIGNSSQGDYDDSVLTTSSSGTHGNRRRRKVPSLPTRKGGGKSKTPKEQHQSASASASASSSSPSQQKKPKKRNSLVDTSSGRFSVNRRRSFFAASKPFTPDDGSFNEEGEDGVKSPQRAGGGGAAADNNDNNTNDNHDERREQVDPTTTAASPESKREYAFVISVGILLAFNMGFVNGACLSGFVTHTQRRQGVAGYSNPYTDSALYIADGDYEKSKFQTVLIACFIGGSFISGVATPNAVPYRIEPTYGPSFLVSAVCLGLATLLAATSHDNDDFVFYLAGTASGIQNGISSSYTAKLIRSTGLTGSSTDIGLYLGQLVRGNNENRPKLIVLCMLAIAFWCGGFISFYVTRHFTSLALLFSTTLFLIIGLSLMIFLVKKLNISFQAAILGTWQWKVAVEKIQCAFEEILDMSGHLNSMSDRELEEIFERIDIDNSGTIDSEELYILLRSTGVKITREESDAMLKFADKDKDGVLSMEEWKNAIHGAMKRKSGNVVSRRIKKVTESSRNVLSVGMASTRDLMAATRNKSDGTSSHFSGTSSYRNFSFRGNKNSASVSSINDISYSDSETQAGGRRHSDFVASQLQFSDELVDGSENINAQSTNPKKPALAEDTVDM